MGISCFLGLTIAFLSFFNFRARLYSYCCMLNPAPAALFFIHEGRQRGV